MARCKLLSPAMLVLHLLLILIFSDLTLGAPAGGAIGKGKHGEQPPARNSGSGPIDRWRTIIDSLEKIGKQRKQPRGIAPPELARTRVPALTDPPVVLALSVPVGTLVPRCSGHRPSSCRCSLRFRRRQNRHWHVGRRQERPDHQPTTRPLYLKAGELILSNTASHISPTFRPILLVSVSVLSEATIANVLTFELTLEASLTAKRVFTLLENTLRPAAGVTAA